VREICEEFSHTQGQLEAHWSGDLFGLSCVLLGWAPLQQLDIGCCDLDEAPLWLLSGRWGAAFLELLELCCTQSIG